MSARTMLILAAILGGLAVAAGAFGARVLDGQLTERQARNFDTAARYQMYHAIALAMVGLVALRQTDFKLRPPLALRLAAFCFCFGTLVFSGLLYVLALGGHSALGAFVPIGGTALILGWLPWVRGRGQHQVEPLPELRLAITACSAG